VDESDPNYEYNELISEISRLCEISHWKAAVRRLRTLVRRFGSTNKVPASVFEVSLEACMQDRLQGARASEPARKIMEQMVELGYGISQSAGNYCIKNTISGIGEDATHEGFGGLDTALSMKMAMDLANVKLQLDTVELLAVVQARWGQVDEGVKLLQTAMNENETIESPTLETFTQLAQSAVRANSPELVATILSLANSAGYDLDTIGSLESGVSLIAAGVMAADRLNNVALGLRLLTASRKVEGGDIQVANSSDGARRSCVRIHYKAINSAVKDSQWKLAVAVLNLMLERDLSPSRWAWRIVVTCCAKAEKSRKATALLLDWVKLHGEGKAEKPPLTVFNTVVNACEICQEHELTLAVLEAMKSTHNTEGNLITFNIALKRLAKLGNSVACEGIILGMLQNEVEPSVVSYTTAIAACANKDNKQPAVAYEWVKRMKSRLVKPNVLTYNTAIAACHDGSLEGAVLATQICSEMLVDAATQQTKCDVEYDQYSDVLPNAVSKMLARQVLSDLESLGSEDESLRMPVQGIIDFKKSETDELCEVPADESKIEKLVATEAELEFSVASSTHRVAEV